MKAHVGLMKENSTDLRESIGKRTEMGGPPAQPSPFLKDPGFPFCFPGFRKLSCKVLLKNFEIKQCKQFKPQ